MQIACADIENMYNGLCVKKFTLHRLSLARGVN